jgi:cytochrome P450
VEKLDLTSHEAIQRPYPIYKFMREQLPVHWNPSLKGWFVSRFADVQAALMNQDLSVEKMSGFGERDHGALQDKIATLTEVIGGWMVFKDPPDHTRLRKVMQPAFLPSKIEKLRPKIEAVSEQLLQKVAEKHEREGQVDLIWDYAFPLPAIVVGELCGVPAQEAERLKYWADNIGKFVLQGRATPDKYDRSYHACVAFYQDLVTKERKLRSDNLVSRMIESSGLDTPLSDDEIVSMLVLLLFAGHETTTNLIANGMLALMQHPEQLALLQSDLSLVESAVEEFLRFEGPAAVVVRIAKKPMEIGGEKIALGERVFLGLNAADHDPTRFDDPHCLNVPRPGRKHIAFGQGVHTCLGAPLARLEGRVAFEMLLERFTGFELRSTDLEWRDELITRGLKSLPISFQKRA